MGFLTGLFKALFGKSNDVTRGMGSFPVAPVIDEPAERPQGGEFRRFGDDENVIRIYFGPGRGRRKVVNYMSVAGTSYRYDAVCAFIRGKDREVYLKEEPDNPVDENAIGVYGIWRGVTGKHDALLGYVPSSHLDRFKDRGLDGITVSLDAMFAPESKTDNPGLKVTIWER